MILSDAEHYTQAQLVARLDKVRSSLSEKHAAHKEKLAVADQYYFYGIRNISSGNMAAPTETRMSLDIPDNVGAIALQRLSGHLCGSLFNPQSNWGQVVSSQDYAKIGDAAIEWLREATEVMMRTLAAPEARFYSEMASAMTECVIGQGMLYVDRPKVDGVEKLLFKAFPMTAISQSLDGYGKLNTVVRSIPMTRAEILSRWPADKVSYPKAFLSNTMTNLQKEVQVHHIVLPNETYNQYIEDEARDILRQDLKHEWISYYYIRDGVNVILEQYSMPYMPYIPLRFSQRAGSTYGEGPGLWALANVIEFVRRARTIGVALDLGLLGPLLETPGMLPEHIEMKQLSRTVANRSFIEKPPLENLLPPSSIDPSKLENYQELMRQQILQTFYNDRIGTPVKTAEMRQVEVLGRQQDNITELIPFVARMDAEVADPIMRIVLDYCIDNKLLSEMPKTLAPVANANGVFSPQVHLRYQSQMAKAQQQAANRESLDFVTNALAPLASLSPSVLEFIKWPVLMKIIANPFIHDTRFIKTEEEATKDQEAKVAQEQAAQMQSAEAQQVQAQAAAAKNYAQAGQIQAETGGML
jgi:hypothetical protein